MKLQWMLAMLQLASTGVSGHPPEPGDTARAEPAAPTWTIDPTTPGSDLPAAGASLFDRITLDEQGRRQIPFPFERFVARIEAAAGCDASRPCTKAVLIPLGRSLQRSAASPDFFRHPRIVTAVVADGAGLRLRDRLYVGFQDRAAVIEVISYNESLGRFEFQIAKNYAAGKVPEVSYARRTLCVACHQNHGPIFSQQVWLETNANPQVAARLEREQQSFAGIAARTNTDVAQAIDDATDRANRLALTQRLWREGCGPGAPGDACRRGALTAALQFTLTGQRSYAMSADAFQRTVLQSLQTNARRAWPGGLALSDPDIPNRDPLDLPQGSTGATLANIDPRFDPLVPRSPLEILPAEGRALAVQLVTGVVAFWSEHDRSALADAMERRAGRASHRRPTVPCRISGSRGLEEFECAAADDSLRLRGAFDHMGGTLDEIGVGGDEPVRHLHIDALQRQSSAGTTTARFRVRDQQRVARLADGNAVEAIELRWQAATGASDSGVASVQIREDFPAIADVVAAMDVSAPVLRASLVDAVAARLDGVAPPTAREIRLPASTRPEAAVSPADPTAARFEVQCGGCHHTSEVTPPNFLSGDAQRVKAALQSCAPRMLVRLAMRDVPATQRAKSPMPPESLVIPTRGGEHGSGAASDQRALRELRAAVEATLIREYGHLPTADELLRQGYESLRPCLP